jgi:ankyrin repeat protein
VVVQCWQDDENVVRRMPSKEPDLLKIAELLVRAGARLDNVKGTGESRETAIGLATHYGQVDVVKLLIRAGANVNLGNGKGRTALHVAAEKFARDDLINFDAEMQLQLLQVLLAGGADINGKDDKGDPPLCRALHGSPANPRIKIVEILLKAGAKPLLMEQCRGQDGRAWAPNESINQLLRSYGAK